MPQVPYSPVPNVEPTQGGPGSISVPTPVEAFGGATAKAVQGLGAELGHVGDEIFKRAIAIQQLNNEADANNASTDYMIQAGELHAKYGALQGQEAVKAYPDYVRNLSDLRSTIRGNLTNPMAQKMYDAESRSMMARTIFNGAGHAATQQRESVLSAATAKQEVLRKTVEDNPDDEASFDAAIAENHQSAAQRAELMPGGSSPERVEFLTKVGDSEIAYRRIVAIARNQPNKASELLKDYEQRGLLFGNQLEQARAKVQSFTHTVSMDTLATDVLAKNTKPDGSFAKSFVEMQEEARTQAQKMYPNDPTIGTAAASMFDKQYNQRAWAKTKDDQQTAATLNDYIVKGASQVGQLPPDLTARMTPKQIKDYPGMANSYRRSQDALTNRDAYTNLLGLYNNDNAKFMDTNLMTYPGLSKSNIDFFLKLQRQSSTGDPRVKRALDWIRGRDGSTLVNLFGSTGQTTDNREDYNRFVGTLHDAIQAHQETYGKPPTEKEVTQEIFPSVIGEVTQPGFWSIGGWGTTNKVPFFKADIPDAVREAVQKDSGGKALTDDEIRHLWAQENFLKLYNEKKASKPKDQGKVQ